jgi:hypothetical protein
MSDTPLKSITTAINCAEQSDEAIRIAFGSKRKRLHSSRKAEWIDSPRSQ